MSWYKNYRLINDGNGYTVIIYLNPNATEFSSELVTNIKENILELDAQIREFTCEKLSGLKINAIKLVLGTLVVGTIPFLHSPKAHAAGTTVQATTNMYAKGIVTATKLNVRSGPSTNNPIIHLLWKDNVVNIITASNGWYKIKLSDGRIGWVSRYFIKIPDRQQKINLLISTAKSFVGTPYVWGGESIEEGGFDCSGFTQYVFKQVGYNLNRVSSDQAKQGWYVSRQNLQPGDLVFYSFEKDGRISHVGIYIGDGKMIHSPKTGDVVKITNITTWYWQERFLTARRIF
jgi:hypothetical protein